METPVTIKTILKNYTHETHSVLLSDGRVLELWNGKGQWNRRDEWDGDFEVGARLGSSRKVLARTIYTFSNKPETFTLCHKCEGSLGLGHDNLYGCMCISSGYIVGVSSVKELHECIEIQNNERASSLKMFVGQKRSDYEIEKALERYEPKERLITPEKEGPVIEPIISEPRVYNYADFTEAYKGLLMWSRSTDVGNHKILWTVDDGEPQELEVTREDGDVVLIGNGMATFNNIHSGVAHAIDWMKWTMDVEGNIAMPMAILQGHPKNSLEKVIEMPDEQMCHPQRNPMKFRKYIITLSERMRLGETILIHWNSLDDKGEGCEFVLEITPCGVTTFDNGFCGYDVGDGETVEETIDECLTELFNYY